MVGCKGPAFGPVFAVPACVCPGDVSLEFAKEVMIFRFQPCKAAGRLFENADASLAHYGIEELSSSAVDLFALSHFLLLGWVKVW